MTFYPWDRENLDPVEREFIDAIRVHRLPSEQCRFLLRNHKGAMSSAASGEIRELTGQQIGLGGWSEAVPAVEEYFRNKDR